MVHAVFRTASIPDRVNKKLEGLPGDLEMDYAVYRIPVVPIRVNTERLPGD
jgi:hypothetical protein